MLYSDVVSCGACPSQLSPQEHALAVKRRHPKPAGTEGTYVTWVNLVTIANHVGGGLTFDSLDSGRPCLVTFPP